MEDNSGGWGVGSDWKEGTGSGRDLDKLDVLLPESQPSNQNIAAKEEEAGLLS